MYGGISHKIASRRASAYTVAASEFVFVAHATSPFVTVYRWLGGFAEKMSDPSTLPPGQCNKVAVTSNGDAVILTSNSSPYVLAYGWSKQGFGTKFTDPVTLPTGICSRVQVRTGNNAVLLVHSSNSPFVSAYPWSTSGFGTKYTDPASIRPSDASFDADGDRVFSTSSGQAPIVRIFDVSTGFGNTTSSGNFVFESVAFSPNNSYVARINRISQAQIDAFGLTFIQVFTWNNSGPGTMYAPVVKTPATGTPRGMFAPDNNSIVGWESTAGLHGYPWNNPEFGNKFSNPSPAPGGTVNDAAFTSDSKYLLVAHTSSPYISAYNWSSTSGFGSKITNPANLPAGAGQGVAFVQIA